MIPENSYRFTIGTTAMWEAHNDIIPVGVPCVEIKTNNTVSWKLGDGINTWINLLPKETLGDFVITGFIPNHQYSAKSVIVHNNELRIAKNNFTTSTIFNEADWDRSGNYYTKSEADTLYALLAPLTTIDKQVLNGLSVQTTTSDFQLKVNVINIKTGNTGEQVVTLPHVTSSAPGIMPAEVYTTVLNNQAGLAALQGRILRYIGDFSICSDPDNPTQAELTTIYENASGLSGNPIDGTSLRNETTKKEYMWYTSTNTWYAGNSTIPVFGEGQAGLIIGVTDEVANDGSVTATADGKGKVVGWLPLKETVSNKVTDIGDPIHTTLQETISNGVDKFPSGKTILNLQIKDDQLHQ
jgi:hypothetical protein